MKKAPDFRPGLSSLSCGFLETVVQARTHDVHFQVDIGRGAACRRFARRVADIGVEIFELRGPVVGDHAFDADADRPAGIGVARAGKAAEVRLDVAERDAAGDIRQPAIPRVTDAAAHRAEPAVLGFAGGSAANRGVTDVGPIDVAFEAEHPRAAERLPIVAGGDAEHAAARAVADGEAVPVGITEGAAAVYAAIEAGPGVSR